MQMVRHMDTRTVLDSSFGKLFLKIYLFILAVILDVICFKTDELKVFQQSPLQLHHRLMRVTVKSLCTFFILLAQDK